MNTRNEIKFSTKLKMLFRRLFSVLYDCLLMLGVLFVVGSVAIYFNDGQAYDNPYLSNGLLLLTSALFFCGFWTHGGQTLGMQAWRIKMTTANFTPVPWKNAIVRFLFALATFGVGTIWVLFDKDGRTLQDIVAGTLVTHQPKQNKTS